MAVEPDELIRLAGERPNQQRVDQREHGAVGADAEGQDEDRDHGEPGGLYERAGPIPQILKKLAHMRPLDGIPLPEVPVTARLTPLQVNDPGAAVVHVHIYFLVCQNAKPPQDSRRFRRCQCLFRVLFVAEGERQCRARSSRPRDREAGRAAVRAGPAAAGRRGGGGPVPVVTAKVQTKSVPVTIPAVGTAEPLQTVQIRAQVTGQLSAIHFSEGQDVRKGQPLFTLDPRPFQAALQQAEAVLARDTAKAKNAERQKAPYEDLFKRGLIPRDQYETQTRRASTRSRRRSPPISRRSRTPS